MASVLDRTEGSIVLTHVSWRTYVSLLEDLAESATPHLTYDRGTLEITSPTKKHERINRVIAQLVEVAADELGMDLENLGSTTFKREDLERGFEPDSCFYFDHAERVRSKDELDLALDPPPELVIEIDITSTSIAKDPIYAQMGVREVWRFDGSSVRIGTLADGAYRPSEVSLVLPPLTAAAISKFLERSLTTKRPDLLELLRQWIRDEGARATGDHS